MTEQFNPNDPAPSLSKPKPTVVHPDQPVPHVTSPEGATQVFRASGEFGDKVAIGCFSVSNFGVFASSEQGVGLFAVGAEFAAQLEGRLQVTGDCDVGGSLHTTGDQVCDGDLRTRGDHIVDGDIQLSGADYAEDFDVVGLDEAAPGTVMVLDDAGGVRSCSQSYDRRVAGVVSGAGGYRPAVILDRHVSATERRPLALMGKVYCRVDASTGPIAIGDLLTTSSTPGHAMKATDPSLAFGAVIGKAMGPLDRGLGLVPILVALQ